MLVLYRFKRFRLLIVDLFVTLFLYFFHFKFLFVGVLFYLLFRYYITKTSVYSFEKIIVLIELLSFALYTVAILFGKEAQTSLLLVQSVLLILLWLYKNIAFYKVSINEMLGLEVETAIFLLLGALVHFVITSLLVFSPGVVMVKLLLDILLILLFSIFLYLLQVRLKIVWILVLVAFFVFTKSLFIWDTLMYFGFIIVIFVFIVEKSVSWLELKYSAENKLNSFKIYIFLVLFLLITVVKTLFLQ